MYTGTSTRPLFHPTTSNAAYGGSIISQAVSAATATVPADFDVYSLQSSFIRPVSPTDPVKYHVERAADGRTFATRVVRVTQGDDSRRLFIANISFQKRIISTNIKALEYADSLPALPDIRISDVTKLGLEQLGFQIAESAGPSQLSADEEPFECRPLDLQPFSDLSQVRALGFVRAAPLSADIRVAHLASLAFLSDVSLLEIALFMSWEKIDERARNLVMSTTLTHHISFHSPKAKADEWMVVESKTSWGAQGRVFLHHRFWNYETGELVISCTQEALIPLEKSQL
jgi:acyl-CoA thioesterase 8